MALKYSQASDQKWYKELSAGTNDYSPVQIIPGYVDDLVACVKPTGGGFVQLEFTADDVELIDSDPGSVTWLVWNVGAVNITRAQTALGAVSAVRIKALSAPATCTLVGNKRTTRR